jgi:uncharacterized protein YecE (DUF72 family)
MSSLHVGTSGWSYKHWKHVFYPKEVKSAQWLEYYAEHFDCVELNSSFYHLPQTETVKGWRKRAPDHFKFCFKLSRYITQLKKLNDVQEPLENFFARMQPLQKCAGPVLVQLPPQLGFHSETVEHFFELLKKFKAYRFALEARHASWLKSDAQQLVEKYRIAFVIAESGGRHPYQETLTTDFVYLRFHGVNSSYATEYDDAALKKYARLIQQWLRAQHEVWAFFNNDAHAFAVKNALTLREMVQH